MKKYSIALILVLVLSVCSAFALNSFDIYVGAGYDVRADKKNNVGSNSFAADASIRLPLTDVLNLYGDVSVKFAGKGKAYSENESVAFQKNFLGTSVHAGVLYGFRFVENPKVEMYFGGGFAYQKTGGNNDAETPVFFKDYGIGLKFNVAYRFNRNFAAMFDITPDMNFYEIKKTGGFAIGYGVTATAGVLLSL